MDTKIRAFWAALLILAVVSERVGSTSIKSSQRPTSLREIYRQKYDFEASINRMRPRAENSQKDKESGDRPQGSNAYLIKAADVPKISTHDPTLVETSATHEPERILDAISPSPSPPVPLTTDTSTIEIVTVRGSPDIQICRVRRACTVGDGSVLLPAWMKLYKSHLEKCGLANVQFVLQSGKDEAGNEQLEARQIQRPKELTHLFGSYDLLGSSPPADQRQHLVVDLWPLLMAADVLKNRNNYNGSVESLCVRQGGGKCDQSAKYSMHLMIRATTAISSLKDTSWVKGFLRLIRNGLLGDLRLVDTAELYGWRIRGQAACVRSIITSGGNVSSMSSKAVAPNHFMFAENELSRLPRFTSSTTRDSGCVVRVMILNRYGKRFMIGDEALRSAISQEASKITAKHPYMSIQSEVVFFENSSFHEQVGMAQEANIIIASHGEANTNVVFLRPGSALIEILPFGYSSGPYNDLARIFGVEYTKIVAEPDDEVFKSCITHFNPKASSERDKFLESWIAKASKVRARTILASAESNFSFASNDDPRLQGVEKARQCMGFQRLSFNVKDLAKQAVEIGMKQCGVDQTR